VSVNSLNRDLVTYDKCHDYVQQDAHLIRANRGLIRRATGAEWPGVSVAVVMRNNEEGGVGGSRNQIVLDVKFKVCKKQLTERSTER
jgi:hypothetical protein